MVQSRRNPNEIPSVLGFRSMTVLTGSMRPMLKEGDMIITKNIDPSKIKENDVITYKIGYNTLVTHRVVEVVEENGEMFFKTKGDANNTEDQGLIAPKDLVGTHLITIPKLGYVKNFIQKPIGFIALIILPIILLILGELKTILSLDNSKKGSNKDSKDGIEIN